MPPFSDNLISRWQHIPFGRSFRFPGTDQKVTRLLFLSLKQTRNLCMWTGSDRTWYKATACTEIEIKAKYLKKINYKVMLQMIESNLSKND